MRLSWIEDPDQQGYDSKLRYGVRKDIGGEAGYGRQYRCGLLFWGEGCCVAPVAALDGPYLEAYCDVAEQLRGDR